MAQIVNIELDKPRRLKFDINAFSDAEEALGMSMGAAMKTNMGFRSIRALCWAGLKWEDRGLTEERVGTILQKHIEGGGSLEAVSLKVAEAIAASGLFKADDDEGNGTAEAAQ